jgi:hypothetical protein
MENDNFLKKENALIAIGLLFVVISITTLEEEQTLKYLGLASSMGIFILAIYLKYTKIRRDN